MYKSIGNLQRRPKLTELGTLNFSVCKGKELSGKRKIGEVERPASGGDRYLPSSFALLDSFGDIKALSLDKFGALRDPEDVERPRLFRRVDQTTAAGSSTGSFTPGLVEYRRIETGGKGRDIAAANDSSSTWSKYIDLDWENEGTSGLGSSKVGNIEAADPSSRSSVPISCTVHERRSTSRGTPTLQQQLRAPPQQVSGFSASNLTAYLELMHWLH